MERRLSAILAADVVGYSRLMAADETGTHARLRFLRESFIDRVTAEHHGRIVKLMGDGAIIDFSSVVDAVACAVAIQNGLAERQLEMPANQRILLRIGLNIGDVIFEDGDVYGDGVNIAARLEPLAEPGGVCVSRTVVDYAKGKVDIDFQPMGAHQLKNIPEPVEVYRIATLAGPGASRQAGWLVGWIMAGAALALVTAVALVLWFQPWQSRPAVWAENEAAAPSAQPSLAVLPFDNLGGEPEEDYFAHGLTDDLITGLSKISGLFVIARNSVFKYGDRPADVREVARDLGVRYVLEGSVRRFGERMRINVQLIDSRSGGHLWTERFDRDAADIFAVQDEVIGQIVDALAVELSPSERQRVARFPTTNLEAYDHYLRAEQAARTGFRPELRLALHLYEKAVALDPTFARAFAADARTAAYAMRNNYDDVLPWPVARKRAYEHASRALEIDPEAPLPFSVLAVLQVVDGRHEDAIRSARQAVALGPSEAEAHAALSLVLTFSSRHAEAVAAIERAMQLNPELPTGDRVIAAMAFLLDGQQDRSIEILESARENAPHVDDVHAMLAASYAVDGQLARARHNAAEAVRLSPNLCVEVYRVILAHFRSERDLSLILEAMTAAGLPQWPYGFGAGSADRLGEREIGALAFGRVWQGRLESGGPAVMQIGEDGALAFRATTYIVTGRAFIDGNSLCEQIEALSLGRPVCGPIYRAEASSGGETAYTYANASKVFHFAPLE